MSDTPDLDSLESAISRWLSREAAGMERAVTRDQLVDRLSSVGWSLSDRKMRAVVHHMVVVHHVPICTSAHRGYWMAVGPTDIEEAAAMLRAAGKEFFERAEALEACGPWADRAQPELLLWRKPRPSRTEAPP